MKLNLQIIKKMIKNSFFEFGLDTLGLNDGEQVSYYFEVGDNDGINGSKKTKSADFIFKKKTKAENIAEKDAMNDKLKNSLNNTSNKTEDLKKEIEELNKELLNKKKLDWQENKKQKKF